MPNINRINKVWRYQVGSQEVVKDREYNEHKRQTSNRQTMIYAKTG